MKPFRFSGACKRTCSLNADSSEDLHKTGRTERLFNYRGGPALPAFLQTEPRMAKQIGTAVVFPRPIYREAIKGYGVLYSN